MDDRASEQPAPHLTPAGTRERLARLKAGRLAIRLEGRRGRLVQVAELYVLTWLLVRDLVAGWPAVMIVSGVVAALTAAILALMYLGPARLALPLAERAEPQPSEDAPPVRDWRLIAAFATALAVFVLLGFLLRRTLWIGGVGFLVLLGRHLWETSALGRRHARMGPDESLVLTLLDERRARRRR